MTKVAVTGGSGKLGTYAIRELLDHGYEVVNLDTRPPREPVCRTIRLNLASLGEVYGGLEGADAVIHLAAIPSPGGQPNEVVYANNVLSTYHVLEAASVLKLNKAVIASSMSAYGFCYAKKPFDPLYAPIDEQHPLLAQDCYGLSKAVNEQTAEMFHRRCGMQTPSLRLATVIAPEEMEGFKRSMLSSPVSPLVFWSYIDVRDAAKACRLALEAEGIGSEAFNICADTTYMNVPSAELFASHYPNVADIRKPLDGTETIFSNEKAKRLLGWKPRY